MPSVSAKRCRSVIVTTESLYVHPNERTWELGHGLPMARFRGTVSKTGQLIHILVMGEVWDQLSPITNRGCPNQVKIKGFDLDYRNKFEEEDKVFVAMSVEGVE